MGVPKGTPKPLPRVPRRPKSASGPKTPHILFKESRFLLKNGAKTPFWHPFEHLGLPLGSQGVQEGLGRVRKGFGRGSKGSGSQLLASGPLRTPSEPLPNPSEPFRTPFRSQGGVPGPLDAIQRLTGSSLGFPKPEVYPEAAVVSSWYPFRGLGVRGWGGGWVGRGWDGRKGVGG